MPGSAGATSRTSTTGGADPPACLLVLAAAAVAAQALDVAVDAQRHAVDFGRKGLGDDRNAQPPMGRRQFVNHQVGDRQIDGQGSRHRGLRRHRARQHGRHDRTEDNNNNNSQRARNKGTTHHRHHQA